MAVEHTKALPGRWRVYQDIPIDEAMTRYVERFGVVPEAAVINTGYRLEDDEAAALRKDNVQLLQLGNVHDVWLGPVPE